MTFVKLNNVHQVFLSHQKRQFSTFQILRNGLRGFRKMKTKSEMELDKLKGNPNFYYVSNRFMFAPERLKNQPKPSKSSSDRNFKILFGVLFSMDLAVDLYCLKNNFKLKEKLEKILPDGQWSEAFSEAASEVDKLSFNKDNYICGVAGNRVQAGSRTNLKIHPQWDLRVFGFKLKYFLTTLHSSYPQFDSY